MDPLPHSQRALKVRGPGDVVLDEACALPSFEKDEILVRVRCVGINPVDVKVLDMAPHASATIGCEFAGDVVRLGSSVKNGQLKLGVAVFGCVCGNNPDRPDNGAFADYVAVAGDLVYLLPLHLSYHHGATLGAVLPTVGMAVYNLWGLRLPYTDHQAEETKSMEKDSAVPVNYIGGGYKGNNNPSLPPPPLTANVTPEELGAGRYVLVYGGSTACGAMALQLIQKSGFVVVCTCSPRNFAMVKTLGAQKAFDYHSPSCGDEIRRYTADTLAYALDCITDPSSMRICYAAMGRAGGKYMGLNPIPVRAHTRRDIKPDYVLVYTMFGKEVNWPRPFARPARPKDRTFAERWYQATQILVNIPDEILPHPVDLHSDGFRGVVRGLDRMRKGDISGVKLVYDLA